MSYICGKKVVMDTIDDDPQSVRYVYLLKSYEKIINKCKESGIPFEVIHSEKFFTSKVNRAHHQGVMAEIEDFKYVELPELMENAKRSKHPLLVITDGIEDPHNLGAIIRACDAAKVDGLIVKNHNQVHVTPTVTKVSMGSTRNVPICIVNNVTETIKKLQQAGFWTVGAALEGNQSIWDIDYDFPVVLIVGNEKSGISRLVLNNCDYKVRIPMYGKAESLNVSVATGVMLYEIRRKHNL